MLEQSPCNTFLSSYYKEHLYSFSDPLKQLMYSNIVISFFKHFAQMNRRLLILMDSDLVLFQIPRMRLSAVSTYPLSSSQPKTN